MTGALLYGAGAGALHAVTGPDHMLALGPAALAARARSWQLGAVWGAGHALGTVALGAPLILFAQALPVELVSTWGERLAGLALIGMALASWTRADHRHAPHPGSAFVVGLVHGATGAGSLVLLLPVLVTSSPLLGTAFLLAFGVGGTLAMAALTSALGLGGVHLGERTVFGLRVGLTLASVGLGAAWLLG